MDSKKLAEAFLNQISNTDHLKMDRTFSKNVQGDSFVLNYLFTHDGKAYPKELSSAMAVSTARIAKILGDLTARGLVKRELDLNDTRQIKVLLTKKGTDLVVNLRDEAVTNLAKCFSKLDEKDIEDFIRIREKITKAMRENDMFE